MIVVEQSKNYDYLKVVEMALTPKELAKTQELAAWIDRWEPGRQGGDLYFKYNLKQECRFAEEADWLREVVDHMAEFLVDVRKPFLKPNDMNFWLTFDAYLIYYPEGGGVYWHRDPVAEEGKKHRRMNIVITEPRAGGELSLRFTGAGQDYSRCLRLRPNQGVIFEPSEVLHMVSPCVEGGRLVLSVGALVDR